MSCGNCEQTTLPPPTGSTTEEVGREAESCARLRVVEARWECSLEENVVRCGDEVTLQATVRGPGSRSNEPVDFVVTHCHGGEQITTFQDETRRHRAEATWISQKQCEVSDEQAVRFTARADGSSRDADYLSFHRYEDFEERAVQVDGGLDRPCVDLAFTRDREFTITVKIFLIPREPRGGERPEVDEALPYAETAPAINESEPIGEAPSNETLETLSSRIEAVYRDQWILHRHDCQRGEACDCPVSYRCCKFPLKVRVEILDYRSTRDPQHDRDGGRPFNTVQTWLNLEHVVNLWTGRGRDSTYDWYREPSPGDPCDAHRAGKRNDCEACQSLEGDLACENHRYGYAHGDCEKCQGIQQYNQARIHAHEVGHYMGFYDEYPDGRTNNEHGTPWQTNASGNLMALSRDGRSVGRDVPAYYFEWFRDFFSKRMGEEFDLIAAPKSEDSE